MRRAKEYGLADARQFVKVEVFAVQGTAPCPALEFTSLKKYVEEKS